MARFTISVRVTTHFLRLFLPSCLPHAEAPSVFDPFELRTAGKRNLNGRGESPSPRRPGHQFAKLNKESRKTGGKKLALEHEALTERIIGAAIEVATGGSGRVFSNQCNRPPAASALVSC